MTKRTGITEVERLRRWESVARAQGIAIVLNKIEIMLFTNLQYLFDIVWISQCMGKKDSPGLFSYCISNPFWLRNQGLQLYIHKNRDTAILNNRCKRCWKTCCCSYNLIPFLKWSLQKGAKKGSKCEQICR